MTRRLIFTLLHDSGQFMLSRNFRLQKVGTINWLFDNYDFAKVSHGLDELMVLDVTKGPRNASEFCEKVQHIAGRCFIPLTVGGGIDSFEVAQQYMGSGADKLLVNSAFGSAPGMCMELAAHFGRQCIVAGIDYRIDAQGRRTVFTQGATQGVGQDLSDWVDHVLACGAGELLFQSVDQDGTGMGLDMSVLQSLRMQPEVPCILMGGVGKSSQIIAAMQQPAVDAVATANLFNFIGAAFLEARQAIVHAGVPIPQWDDRDYAMLRNRFAGA
ncbi:imidazole glycerol phosphate synthase subunit HisF [Denitratisoma sp. agr-D3]